MKQLKLHVLLGIGLTSTFAVQAETQMVTVAKSNGAVQCGNAGIGLKKMQKKLTQAKIPSRDARCGNDGLFHPAVCGGETGRLNLYDIPANKLGAAVYLGFQPLSDLPYASEAPCELASKAAEITITGIGPAVDGNAYRRVRKTIGNAVADNVISRFIVYNYGVEGGFSSCVEAGRFAPDNSFSDFINRLRAIHANPNTTAYSVTAVDTCVTNTAE